MLFLRTWHDSCAFGGRGGMILAISNFRTIGGRGGMILACKKLSTGCPQLIHSPHVGCASAKPCIVQILEVSCAPIIQWRTNTCQVYFRFWLRRVQKFVFDQFLRILYNIYIDERETNMTDNEFFKLDQELWFTEYVELELSKKVSDTNTQIENFFLDVPF
jgi:hypothetical protein